MKHISVLLKESITDLNIKEDGIYVDATLGYAGHSKEILKRLTTGHLYCIDQDIEAINYSDNELKKISDNYTIIKSNFKNIMAELSKYNVHKVDGILYDIGVSSAQLDEDERGFSFHHDAPLDMRMDLSNPLTAYIVVNEYSYEDLKKIISTYGEEKYASSIAKNIVKYRDSKKIETTLELVDIIKSSMPMKAMRDTHPARRTFQAIRIEVNKELEVLEESLISSLALLNVGGRICVITFHSLEDKIVKNIFKKYSEVDDKLKNLPYIPEEYMPKYRVIEKGLVPTKEEVEVNKRARSAKMRVIERIKD